MMNELKGRKKSGLLSICSDGWYLYDELSFRFDVIDYHKLDQLWFIVKIPTDIIKGFQVNTDRLACEHFLLTAIAQKVDELELDYRNNNKGVREKPHFSCQFPGERILSRNGIVFNKKENAFCAKIKYCVPMINSTSINTKAMIASIKDAMQRFLFVLEHLDKSELDLLITTHRYQQEIRALLQTNNLCAFISDGSILPRENGTSKPKSKSIPFETPMELKISLTMSDGKVFTGMGVQKGVTVITGGGYSGKSTLLDAIEEGVYDHIPGDGREYVITDRSALKIYAEDGRPIHSLDLTPFFKKIPGQEDVSAFSTRHASGSVSQAANIIEAVYAKSNTLLIDEDKSATNFMIRDIQMRDIIKNDPIIPFTDRVRELYLSVGVSTILVIGGSSEYLAYADHVILMDEYTPKDITDKVKTYNIVVHDKKEVPATWVYSRRLLPVQTSAPYPIFKSIQTENQKKIILDDLSADITLLSAVKTDEQLNTLANVMEQLLTDMQASDTELLELIVCVLNKMFLEDDVVVKTMLNNVEQRWYEEVRPLDALCCIFRMRGINIVSGSIE